MVLTVNIDNRKRVTCFCPLQYLKIYKHVTLLLNLRKIGTGENHIFLQIVISRNNHVMYTKHDITSKIMEIRKAGGFGAQAWVLGQGVQAGLKTSAKTHIFLYFHILLILLCRV